MQNIRQLALIGSTASGKTSLSIKLAHKTNAHILSLDSLSIYKEIDIVSAKPTHLEREGIKHFGIDLISPRDNFDVTLFIELYRKTYVLCCKEGKNLVIVGGSSFYLKMLMKGISQLPVVSQKTKDTTQVLLQDLSKAHKLLTNVDKNYMSQIQPQDSYRIEKALHIYLETSLAPTTYFEQHPPKSAITNHLPVYQIEWERDVLRKRIALRTKLMIQEGLIDEICFLEKKYTRKPHCMKSIGIKETLEYVDGLYSKKLLIEKITTHTSRLAKRQNTFNNSQFDNVVKGSVEMLEKMLLSHKI